MDYLEFSFHVNPGEPEADILTAELAEAGFESFAETETALLAYIPQNKFTPEAKSLVRDAEEKGMKVEERVLKHQNWNKIWEEEFVPITIGERCGIRASFHEPIKGFEFDIIINPKMSFGTGHHETTSLMIEEMLKMDFSGKKILDAGCGTAVLSILASKMKAGEVAAVDIDESAYINSMENIEVNKCLGISIHKGEVNLLRGKLFNVILANINKNILLESLPTYSEFISSGGDLLMSGFFEYDAEDIEKAALVVGFSSVNKVTKNKWALMHFVKS